MPRDQLFPILLADNLPALKEGLEGGAYSVNDRTSSGATLLHRAAVLGAVRIVRHLVDLDVAVDTRDKNGASALQHAAGEGRLAIVKILVRAGANPSLQDRFGDTAIHRAILGKHRQARKVVAFLVEHGANLDLPNEHGTTDRDWMTWKSKYTDLLDSPSTKLPPYARAGTQTAAIAGRPEEPGGAKTTDGPALLEHPNGDHESAVDAMSDGITRLRKHPRRADWISIEAQGQGSRPDSIRCTAIRLRENQLDLRPHSVDMVAALKRARLGSVKVLKVDGGFVSFTACTPRQVARLLDAIFRGQLGVRPHDGEDDYAVGMEW